MRMPDAFHPMRCVVYCVTTTRAAFRMNNVGESADLACEWECDRVICYRISYWADLLRNMNYCLWSESIASSLCVVQSSENMQCDAIHTWFMRRFIHVCCMGETGRDGYTKQIVWEGIKWKKWMCYGHMKCYWFVLITLHIVNTTVNSGDIWRKDIAKMYKANNRKGFFLTIFRGIKLRKILVFLVRRSIFCC